jgi:hypothetical protein
MNMCTSEKIRKQINIQEIDSIPKLHGDGHFDVWVLFLGLLIDTV